MPDIVAVIVVVLICLLVRKLLSPSEEPVKEDSMPITHIKDKICPPHKWTYLNQEEGTGMHCSLCKQIPGDGR